MIAAPPDTLSVPGPRGIVALRPVDTERDLDLVHDWMNRPHVVEYWQQAWPRDRLHGYLVDQMDDTVSRPCLGLLAGVVVSYWEIYRPAADPLGEAYPARDTDLGVHLLIGDPRATGRGLGGLLLAAVRTGLLAADPACDRIVAEPDVRNVASVRAFQRAGFRRTRDIELTGKTAALMVAEREKQ